MSITPWDNGSRLYRTLLLSGMATVFLGIVLSILATAVSAQWLYWPALICIGAGLATHVSAQVIRVRDARARHAGRPRS